MSCPTYVWVSSPHVILAFSFRCLLLLLQEEGNIPYVVENGVGAFETDPVKIADIMAEWLSPDNKAFFRQMAQRSAALGRPQAVYNIVHDLASLADELGVRSRQLLGSCCGRPRGAPAGPTAGQLVAA